MNKGKLDLDIFQSQMKRLAANLGKLVKRDDLDFIYDEIGWIPTEAWTEIVDAALEQWDTWPRNFPKAIKFLWGGWRSGHKAEVDYQECRFCGETGILEFFKPDETEYSAHETCFCGYCNNYLRHVVSLDFITERDGKKIRCKSLRLTVTEIAARGWLWAEPPPFCTYEETKVANRAMFKALDEKSERIRLSAFEKYGLEEHHETLSPD
jgi:hypothetical protein